MPRKWTEEQKEEQRQRYLQLREEGRIGGSKFGKMGGRPRKPRASELIAQKVEQHADELWDRLYTIAVNGRDAVARQTVMDLLKIEEQERQITVDEENRIEELQRTELLALVADQFAELFERGILEQPSRKTIGDAEIVIDGRLATDGESEQSPAQIARGNGSPD